jgi:chemotaxis response regulator CheB
MPWTGTHHAGRIYVAPPDRHLIIEPNRDPSDALAQRNRVARR